MSEELNNKNIGIRKKALLDGLRGAKTYLEDRTTTQDLNGNVHHHEKTTVSNKGNEPPYIKLFIDDIARIYRLPSERALIELLSLLNYENQIILNAAIKKKIAQRVGYKTVAVLNNYLTSCVKSGVLRHVETGVYEPNPELFGRGSWNEIRERRLSEFWLMVNYDDEGNKTVSSSLGESHRKKNKNNKGDK